MRPFGVLCCLLIAGPAVLAEAGVEYLPGHPWSAVVPDPDTYDWNATNRPGYHFRGMQPAQQRFYNYIQAKRQAGKPLSAVERMMIRHLTAARRWPEAPRPTEFWAAYMRWLRDQTTDDLNAAQNLLLTELMQRGFVVMDQPPTEMVKRAKEYLESGPFECRNWFELHVSDRMEPWMDYALASHGYNLAPPEMDGDLFPAANNVNGMQISYDVSGYHPGGATDRVSGATLVRQLTGTFTPPCTVTVSGAVEFVWFGPPRTNPYTHQGATLLAALTCGDDYQFQREQVVAPDTGSARQSFKVTIRVPAGAEELTVDLSLNGSYPTGSGVQIRNLKIHGELVAGLAPEQQAELDAAAARQAADDAWRRQVDQTLAKLGYSNTPEGRELAAMRDAIHGTDEDWQRYVAAQQKQLGYDDDPVAREFRELRTAAEQGGPAWDAFVREQVGGQGGAIGIGPAPVDITGGTMEVGTGLEDGQLQGVAETFAKPMTLVCKLNHQDLPDGTKVVAVWSCNGDELVRSEREASGTGWVSFGIKRGDGEPLEPGKYKLVVTAEGREMGWRSFVVE